MRGHGERTRRVVVKARIVRLKPGSRAADAHVRYLQRDGTTRDGERGQLYGREIDEADGKAFVERGREDRHQFRFIVAAEDGGKLSDLRAFIRDVMREMERDLDTTLDWIAVDHFNTGHPHSHIIVRGRDNLGKDLIIAQDYITDGIRLRAQHLATLELGFETDRELQTKLQAEISAERFTRIDRAMIAEAKERMLDLRPEAGRVRADFDRTLRIGRLQTLAHYGLAQETEPGAWILSEELEPTLRELGERGDIVKAINRALAARGEQRPLDNYVLHGEAPPSVVGRVIGKHLIDELDDRIGLVIDGADGRMHHIAIDEHGGANDATSGAIIEVRAAGPRPADSNIAALAGETGVYRPSEHRMMAEDRGVRVPGSDYDGYVTSHVRRLEALRRAGIVERVDADQWRIPEDFATRAAAYDARAGGRTTARVLSTLDLEAQIKSDGATWLDRELVAPSRTPYAPFGFAAEVSAAIRRRREVLVTQGHAWTTPEGTFHVPKDLLARLERQEIARVGKSMEVRSHVSFRMAADGERVQGIFTGTAQLASGKFAVIEGSRDFRLVPWRPVMDHYLGRQISGVVRNGGISWDFTRKPGLGM
jgi:type IV secretory pathway VirD2 relaxase